MADITEAIFMVEQGVELDYTELISVRESLSVNES